MRLDDVRLVDSLRRRFWAKVGKQTENGCWVWTGKTDKDGYGHIAVRLSGNRRVSLPASRASYLLTHGEVPDDLLVCHRCPAGNNPACVNPAHLWLGTIQANNADRKARGRKRMSRLTALPVDTLMAQPRRPRRKGPLPSSLKPLAPIVYITLDDIYMLDSVRKRFWERVAVGEGCWLWTAKRTDEGYGYLMVKQIGHRKYMWKAHRVSYLLHHGAIPANRLLRHTCDTPACVNPAHLIVGTQAENVEDMDRRGRRRVGIGERQNSHKLTAAAIPIIRQRYADGETLQAIADAYGVTNQSIHAVVTYKTWRHIK